MSAEDYSKKIDKVIDTYVNAWYDCMAKGDKTARNKEALEFSYKLIAKMTRKLCEGDMDNASTDTLPMHDVSNCDSDTDKYIKEMNIIPRDKLHVKYDK